MIQINVRIFCVSNFSSYNLAIISISSFQSLRLSYEIDTTKTLSQDLDLVHHSFYHDKCVCVCVCVCVCHDSINTIIPYYIYTIHIYLWYDLIRSTLCVVSNSRKKNHLRETLSEYTVRGGG